MKTVDMDLIRKEWGLTESERDSAYREALLSLPLAALRVESDLTQSEMAKRLRKSQAAVSKFEGRGDFLLSTLQRYVDAIDGTLSVAIRTAGKCYHLITSTDDDSPVFHLELADDSEAAAWGGVHYQPPRPTELWTRRNVSVEEVDMCAAFAVSANDFLSIGEYQLEAAA